MSINEQTKSSFLLKGGLYHFMTLRLLAIELDLLDEQLSEQISQAPNFFRNASVVLDLQKLKDLEKIDFTAICKIIRARGLFPIGINNATEQQKKLAYAAGLVSLRSGSEAKNDLSKLNVEPKTSSDHSQNSKLVTLPIRSGQQIYSPGGDLVITSSVSNGAEVLADGNVHIYGTLRGRALAGINGNKDARIFCSSLEAELVSIAGHFKISEDFEDLWKSAVEIYLENERLQIRKL